MTVESELKQEKYVGMKKYTSKRVVDYRVIRDGDVSTPSSERQMTVELPFKGGRKLRFAVATGEDSVEIIRFDLFEGKTVEEVLVGPAINDAHLVSPDGLEEWKWRKTRDGDYPEPASGQVITPVQMKLGLDYTPASI